MNPDAHGEVTDLNLPSPSLETGGKITVGKETPSQPTASPELLNVANAQPMASPATPLVADFSQPSTASSITTNPIGSTNNQQTNDTLAADDGDRIEKAWVIKAKEIVNQTASDPYGQSQAIGRLRADYIKKRYNKDIKMSED